MKILLRKTDNTDWEAFQYFKDDEQADDALVYLQSANDIYEYKLINADDIIKGCTKEEKVETPKIVRSGLYCQEHWMGRCARTKAPCVGLECEWFNK